MIRKFLVLSLFLAISGTAFATPSTTYWSPCVYDIQPYGVGHIGIDNYFTASSAVPAGAFPTDVGYTIGVLPYEKIQMEVGIDYLGPSANPVYFNAKIGTPVDALFPGSPALNLGVFNVGTLKGVTDQNVFDVIVGRPTPLGRIHLGYYVGNENVLVDGAGNKANTGYMIGFDKAFGPVKDANGEYNRYVFAADYASGKNAIGGGGAGLYIYYTPNISLLIGPVFFNDATINGGWKWTTQLDINI